MRRGLSRRTFEILELSSKDDPVGHTFDVFIVTLIVANTVVVVLNTVDGLLQPVAPLAAAFETFAVAVFTLEFVLRVLTCTSDARYRGALLGRLRFMLTPLAVVDLVAILPAYLPFVGANLTLLRILRVLRLLKLGRYSDAFGTLARVLREKRRELLTALLVVGILIVFTSSLLYYVERSAQPRVYSNIPVSMWWSILALTGNGQQAPITVVGRLIGAAVSILGVGLFALPAGIIAGGFTSRRAEQREGAEGASHPPVEEA